MAQSAVKNFVDGHAVDARSGRTYDLVDPVTGEVYATAPRSGPEDVDAAFGAAEDAFASWSTTTPSERSRAIARFADALEARADELVDIECRNTGKPRGADHLRGDPADARPDPLLRRSLPSPRGPVRRGVHAGLHLVHPA